MHSFKLSKIHLGIIILITLCSSSILQAQEIKPKSKFGLFIENHISILAGVNASKQNIQTGSFTSLYNYDLSDYQNNVYKTGYFIGFRIDIMEQAKDKFDFSFHFNKINSGTNYKEAQNFVPLKGNFSKFKADDNFVTFHINSHFKKIVATNKPNTKKLYLIAGPSLDIRLSTQSEENQTNNNYQRIYMNGDMGLEFENKSNYTLFAHYKQPLIAFTKSPIESYLNSVEIGTAIKLSSLLK